MIGLVLAAGTGRRLRPWTDTLPKALVPVDGDTTILDISLHNFAEVGLADVVVVVGYAAHAVRERKAELERRHGVRLELVHNDKAEVWNNAYSLWCARDHLREGAILANGDTVHPVAVEERLLAGRGSAGSAASVDSADIVLAVDDVGELAEEEMKVAVSPEGWLARITKGMDPAAAVGEYIGVTLIEAAAAAPLADALEATWRRDPGLYYEDGYQEYVDRAGRIGLCSIGAAPWTEVDDATDLARARVIAKDLACPC